MLVTIALNDFGGSVMDAKAEDTRSVLICLMVDPTVVLFTLFPNTLYVNLYLDNLQKTVYKLFFLLIYWILVFQDLVMLQCIAVAQRTQKQCWEVKPGMLNDLQCKFLQRWEILCSFLPPWCRWLVKNGTRCGQRLCILRKKMLPVLIDKF